MTLDSTSTIDPPTRHAPSRVSRVAAALAGIVVVLAIVAVTLGIALAAFVGMAVVAWWRRRSARPDTRVARWLGAVTGTGLAAAAVMVFAMLQAQAYADSMTPAQREAVQRQVEARPPSAIERMLPSSAANRDIADARAKRLSGSKLFVVWVTAMTSALAGALIGLVVGSAAWGGATLALFGFTGRWQPLALHAPGFGPDHHPT
jgi:hypothetical protein